MRGLCAAYNLAVNVDVYCAEFEAPGESGVEMPKGSLEIIEFVPRCALPEEAARPHEAALEPPTRVCIAPRALTRLGAALAALTLHALLLAPVIFQALQAHLHPLDRAYTGATALQWVVLTDSPTASTNTPSMAPPAMTPIALTEAASQLLVTSMIPRDSPNAPDQPELAALAGRYTGQIHARIERAWQRPRTSPGDAMFRCQVEVNQDREGHVAEVTVIDCNGDPRWQLSLIRAIQAASPLPAPPVAQVFSYRLVLHFLAAPYRPGAPEELYEPIGAARAVSALEANESALRTLRERSQGAKHTVLQLRIEGSAVTVKQKPSPPRP